MSFLQKKNAHPHIKYLISAIFILIIASLIPLLKNYGSINVWSDVFIPFLPEHSQKMTYEWLDRGNGEYFINTYRVWMYILVPFKKLGLSIYQVGFLLQFSIFFLSGFGIYKIFSLIEGRYSLLGLIPALFFIYSPHLLDHHLYQIGTIGAVWVTYYFIKFIILKKFTFRDAILANLFFASIIDLPNPKYHFLVVLTIVFILSFSLISRVITFSDIKANLKNLVIFILISSYLLLPLGYFAYSFQHFNPTTINTKQGYGTSGETLDYDVAHIHKMMRLFHTPNLDVKSGELINTTFYFFSYYLIPIIILGIFPFVIFKTTGRKKGIYLVIYATALCFIFLSKSSNPPFGFIYENLLSVQSFAFMRTTAGIVLYAAVFYAIIYGLLFSYLHKHFRHKFITLTIFLILISIWGFPLWSGRSFLNRDLSPNQRAKYGLTVPEVYYQAAGFLGQYKTDAKVEIYQAPSGYQQNTWGYNGFIFYPFLIDKPPVYLDNSTREGLNKSRVNMRFILHDKTLLLYGSLPNLQLPKGSQRIFQSSMVDIYRLSDQRFLPHFYTPSRNAVTKKVSKLFLTAIDNSTGYFSTENPPELLKKIPATTKRLPTIEYKKMNPTKYRVIIHGAKGIFPIIFNENFHPSWKLYMGNINTIKKSNKTMRQNLTHFYRVFQQNESDQATTNEAIQLASNGSLSTLGDLKEKQNRVYAYPNSVRTLATSENYRINFISKKFLTTLQNDNLPDNYYFETFVLKEIPDSHLLANNYFNSWLIDTDRICYRNTSCIRNSDSSYDMELVVEFFPQKLVNIGLTISLGTVLIYCFGRVLLLIKKVIR